MPAPDIADPPPARPADPLLPQNNQEPNDKQTRVSIDHVKGPNNTAFSSYTKIGTLAICILSIGLTCILASLGILWFLWQAHERNSTWRAIADRNWFPRAVALFSLVIRQSVSFQAAVATAMMAAIALEQMIVLLLNSASVSLTRNANGGPYMLFWWLWKAFFSNPRRWRTILWPLTITILTISTMLIQLTSFALLSDLDVVITQASSVNETIATHFEYNGKGEIPITLHGSTWSQRLQSYVSFAEYHEPLASSPADGIVDTGVTLRAFLPITDQQSRSMVSSWNGIATVLDASVVCVRPTLFEPHVHYSDGSLALATGFTLNLNLTNQSNLLWNQESKYGCGVSGCLEGTACMIPLSPKTNAAAASLYDVDTSDWRTVICQPSGLLSQTPYMMQSQFQTRGQTTDGRYYEDDTGYSYAYGNAYIIVNVSSGQQEDWAQAIASEDPNLAIFHGPGTPPKSFSVHGQNGEWYDLIYSDDANLNLSVSVCYTAFDTADLLVNIDAASNHSDTTVSWNASTRTYDYAKVRAQFGQAMDGQATYSTDLKERNIMSLRKRQSWIPEPDLGDYVVPANSSSGKGWIRSYANMADDLPSDANNFAGGSNETRFLWNGNQLSSLWSDEMRYDYADSTIMAFFQEILLHGGSLAFAMQSLVTLLTEIAYYQQSERLNGLSDVVWSTYKLTTAPTRSRGLLAVTIVLGVHVMVVFGIILPMFLLKTNISAIGNAWQVVAQLIDAKTKPILEKAPLATDKEAEKEVKVVMGKKKKLKNRDLIGLCLVDESKNGAEEAELRVVMTSPKKD